MWGQWVITSADPVTKAFNTIPLDRATILIAHLHLGTAMDGAAVVLSVRLEA